MIIVFDSFGGFSAQLGALVWLVDPYAREHWVVWCGRPIVRRATARC